MAVRRVASVVREHPGASSRFVARAFARQELDDLLAAAERAGLIRAEVEQRRTKQGRRQTTIWFAVEEDER